MKSWLQLPPAMAAVLTGAHGVVQRALTSLLSHSGRTASPEVTQSVSCSLSYPRSCWQQTRGGPGPGPPQRPAVPHSRPLQ